MHRFYASRMPGEDTFSLQVEDARHAVTVLRLRKGDKVELMVEDRRYAALLLTATPSVVTARVIHELPTTEAGIRVTLFQGLPKGDKMELIIQKAVELGAAAVVPVLMERSVARPDRQGMERKLERWQKIAREACKQSGRTGDMHVHMPLSFAESLQILSAQDAAVCPWEGARKLSLRAWQQENEAARKIGIVIGPEGGISEKEMQDMCKSGVVPVTLGPRILRTETAGLCAISCLMCLYGEMEAVPPDVEEADT